MKDEADPYELLTVEEIKEEFAHAARRWYWTEKKLAAIWRTGGISGQYDNTIKKHVYTRWSIIAYILHVNNILDQQRVDLSQSQNAS